MQREEALKLLKENLKNQNLIKHSLAVEAAMKDLAEFFGEDRGRWGICGLLHDIDYEKVKEYFFTIKDEYMQSVQDWEKL